MNAGDVVTRIAVRRVAAVIDRIAADVPPGLGVERTEEGVVLRGRGLRMRSLTDARLRGLGR